MTKFTKEFIEAELKLVESQEKMSQLKIISDQSKVIDYAKNAIGNYPAALAEIQRLQEKLNAAEKVCKVIKEFRDNGEFFDPHTCRALDAWEKIK